MRFEVPQFIEIEDKIFGPFTWKQFVYLAGGAGAALVLFFVVPLTLFAILGIPIVALSGFLAFHKVNNRPFSIFLESLFGYVTNNRLYIWKRESVGTLRNEDETSEKTIPSYTHDTYSPPITNSSISSLSRKLELHSVDDT